MAKTTILAVLVLAAMMCEARSNPMPPDFVDATTVVPGLALDIRYAGAHNFTGAPVDGYEAPRCWLTREAAAALAGVDADLAGQNLALQVFDCYRPERAVRRFVAWSKAPGDDAAKQEFFPNLPKQALFKLGYIAAHSSHARGSTVDLTLIERRSRRPLDMGSPFDFFGARSHSAYPGLRQEVARRRATLRDAMMHRGFAGYDKEWWHFTLKNEPFPQTTFDTPIR